MNLEEYIQFIGAAAGSDNVGLLAKEAIERMRINVDLIAENNELKRKMSAARRGCLYTFGNGEVCGKFVDDPLCNEHRDQ
jgi:hypothetical protein